ncbi:SLATT domain-containing protein [Nitrincola sp. MINF-07-Sa-05]|uniref:SLATT domain-containing protein n=1 Tax=Nitrincola salilacus TaxID=3400273 RepID=UPI003917BABB
MALSDNIWWTRKARIQTEKRLLSNSMQAQLLLLWYSFCSVSASVYYLKFNPDSDYSGISWVVFSVLIMSMSGFINGLSFKERASLIKECYENLNGLYHIAKSSTDVEIKNLTHEYEQALNMCENHSDRDYYISLCEAHLTSEKPNEKLDRHPTKYIWFLFFLYHLRRFLVFLSLYILPLFLFLIVEMSHVR